MLDPVETGMTADLLAVPAAVFVRSYRPSWAPTLGLAYAARADLASPLTWESHQPAEWVPLLRGRRLLRTRFAG